MLTDAAEIVLSHARLYRAYQAQRPPLIEEIRREVTAALRERDSFRPDHMIDPHVAQLFDGTKVLSDLLLKAFRVLTEKRLCFHHGTLYVTFGHFGAWQRLLTYLPPSPFLAFAYFSRFQGGDVGKDALCPRPDILNARGDSPRPFQYSLLPVPYHPMLAAFLRDSPPYDLHVHLNGTTEADLVWQKALAHPRKALRWINDGRKTEAVRAQYTQYHEVPDEASLRDLVNNARVLRARLQDGQAGHKRYQPSMPLYRHPYPRRDVAHHEAELLWWYDRFREWIRRDEAAAVDTHAYLTAQAAFTRRIVQQESQNGFDQFQKITLNEIRSEVEQRYTQRFYQMSAAGKIAVLEGRFAPKKSAQEMAELLQRIIGDYEQFQGHGTHRTLNQYPKKADAHPTRLRLVAHFIKEKDKEAAHEGYPHLCRHAQLRRKLRRQARILAHLRDRLPKLQTYLTGADAAANELHTPPEVFAPIFHYLRRRGWCDFTYHVGEDYRRLVSGIRACWEAVHYLGLCRGNRLGHATALGIDPEAYLARTPETLRLPRGEVLDDLVFAYHLFSGAGRPLPRHLKDDLCRHYQDIYYPTNPYHPTPGPSHLVDAWKARGYDPLVYLEDDPLPVEPYLAEEWHLVRKQQKQHPRTFDLLKDYHAPEARRRAAEYIDVPRDRFSCDDLRFLQQQVIAMLNQRVVAIESMPTSNVRIAPYHDYPDHHIFRWMGIGTDETGPIVVPASDDPGIFAVNLPGEYGHLLETLVTHFNLSHPEAMAHLKRLHANSRDFAFGIHTPDPVARPFPT